MLMRLGLVLTTEAAERIAIGVVGIVGGDREDIKVNNPAASCGDESLDSY